MVSLRANIHDPVYTLDLEDEAEFACERVLKAWAFLYRDPIDAAVPEGFESGVRALLLMGATGTEILGAVLIAAQKPRLDNPWLYTCGIVRNNLATAERRTAEKRRQELMEPPAEVSWHEETTERRRRPWWKLWGGDKAWA